MFGQFLENSQPELRADLDAEVAWRRLVAASRYGIAVSETVDKIDSHKFENIFHTIADLHVGHFIQCVEGCLGLAIHTEGLALVFSAQAAVEGIGGGYQAPVERANAWDGIRITPSKWWSKRSDTERSVTNS